MELKSAMDTAHLNLVPLLADYRVVLSESHRQKSVMIELIMDSLLVQRGLDLRTGSALEKPYQSKNLYLLS
jgi:hypothetical protein